MAVNADALRETLGALARLDFWSAKASLAAEMRAGRAATSDRPEVILLSARAEELDRIIGLEVGADDYVVKPFNPRELLARIDAVLRRTHALPPSVEAPTGETMRFERWTLKLAERELIDDSGVAHELSTGEYRLLLTFLQRPKVVLTRDQLLDLAFDRGSDVFDRAVDTQVSRLRRKIEADARTPRLIKTVWGGGYVFTAPVEKT